MGKGHRFRSSGDTEVLLHAYQEWGRECLPRLNGMWAFMVYDRRRGTLFGARDRFGVKPLYRYRNGSSLCVAAEIKAIRASGTYPDAIDWERASHFLYLGQLDDRDETFYAGIAQVPAGTAFEVNRAGRVSEWRYWSLDHVPAVKPRDPVAAFRELFDDSVRLRMRSDVPVGVSLSGGLDSSSILCVADRGRRQGDGTGGQPPPALVYIAPGGGAAGFIDDAPSPSAAKPQP